MNYSGNECGIRARVKNFHNVVSAAGSAGGDERHRHAARNHLHQLHVISRLCAIAINARQKNLPRTPIDALGRPLDRIQSRCATPAVRINAPRIALTPSVNGGDHTL